MKVHRVASIPIVLTMFISQLGCTPAEWASALPIINAATTMITDIIDATQKTDLAKRRAKDYFAAHPDAELEAKVDAKIAEVRAGIQIATDLEHGATLASGSSPDPAAAFGAFIKAWGELQALLGPLGIMRSPGALAAARSPQLGAMVEPPFALSYATKGIPTP